MKGDMNLLLDTHVWIWAQERPEELHARVRARLTDARHGVWVSPISTLEIARLRAGGVVQVNMDLSAWVRSSQAALRAGVAAVSDEICMEAYAMPEPFHRDPVDRILVATARLMNLVLVTADDQILRYAHVKSLKAN
jgi:PIN domain nuclease of toxin-antitoxin system